MPYRKPAPDRLPHPGRTSAERRALHEIGTLCAQHCYFS